MRLLAAMLALALSFGAAAQAPSPPLPPSPPRNPTVTIPAPPLAPLPLRVTPTPELVSRWHRARALSVAGTLLSLAGTGLSLASVIYIAATHYPGSNTILNPPAPSDPGPVLAYVGSSTSAVGFVISANALGWEHRLLSRLGVDPGRGLFGIGTAIGLVGFGGVAASYALTFIHPRDPQQQTIAILTTTIAGAGLCAIAGLFYTLDSSRNKKAWMSLGKF